MTLRLDRAAVSSRQAIASIAKSCLYYGRHALLTLLGISLFGVAVALLLPAKYESEARLLALPSDYYAVRNDNNEVAGAEDFKPEEVLNVEMQILSSEDLETEAVVRSGVPAGDKAVIEQARKEFAKNLHIERVEGANVILLSYTAGAPGQAQRKLANLIDSYFDARARVLTSGRVGLLARRRDEAKRRLDKANAALETFQTQHDVADIDAQISGAVTIDTELRQNLSETTADLSQARSALANLRNTASRVPDRVELFRDDSEATRAVAQLQGELLKLQASRADLASRYMEGAAPIAKVDAEIAALRKTIEEKSAGLREARRLGRNTYYDAARDRVFENEAAVSGQTAKLSKLKGEIAQSGERLRALNRIGSRVNDLRIQRDVAVQRYRMLATKVEQARAMEAEALTGSTNIRVIQQPTRPDKRSNSPMLLIAGSILAGLILAVAGLFVVATGRTAILDDAEATAAAGAPVIMDLRQPATAADPAHNRLRQYLAGLHAPPGSGHVIALAGTGARDYAQALRPVIRGLEKTDGSLAVVTFEEAAYGLPFGRLAKFLDGRKFARIKVGTAAWSIDGTGSALIETLRSRHSCVLLVIPPVAGDSADKEASDARLRIAAAADNVLLIMQTERTRTAEAQTVTKALEVLDGHVGGLVLTGRRFHWPRFVRTLK
ncbi:GumC family protein [Novosphingobium mangrovi (ex Huang et al. 2023)]|uniref:Polysaccharide chain length determinant N-terminal domain-containing protein n=1 Tax=Novosphingobium mangrovi (ex Huang et al. 2023) TaxID=2976432 RepID=A0ABT2I528_9SPHN|nr:hypothetical protein [Novosphingobium mangrovi (ex Huang et al. 2023)]MCT2399907.1 hypothetical protein [Novosphingobium mangrovi (ex Huang et al. 2023)]